jgi:hypothetical protein
VVLSGEQLKGCSRANADAAEDIAGSLRSWGKLYSAFRRYGPCDDGAIGEGFSESVSVLMAEEWDSFDELARLTRKDRAFKAFVLKHLDATVPAERLAKIAQLAEAHCSKGSKSLCLDVLKALEKAK